MKNKEEMVTIPKRVYENLLENKKELEIIYELGLQNNDEYKEVYEILDNDLEYK